MFIYTEKLSPRLKYIIHTLLGSYTSDIHITSSITEFHAYDGAKINYSTNKFSSAELHVVPQGLLTEEGIKKQSFAFANWKELKVFFPTKGDIPFDIFAASFYLLSRYEEYLPHAKDSYGRFAHTASIAYREGFLHLPLVNLWMQQFIQVLQQRYPSLQLQSTAFVFKPSYDIDIAYQYGGRGLLRNSLAWIKAISKGQPLRINGKDLFDVYDWLDELHHRHRLSPIYFFLLAKHRSKYDKNLSPRSNRLRQLIRNIAKQYDTGVHPSWGSYADDDLLQKEIDALQSVTGKPVTASRQHYIRFTLPDTFRRLLKAGITADHSMGYGSINGFRASYTFPYYWYDLMKDEPTNLMLHPFCYMEANSFFEQKYNAAQASEELQHYYEVVRSVNGQLITIFHNHFLAEDLQWQPWREMYAAFLQTGFPPASPQDH